MAKADGLIWVKELQFAGGARRCDFWTLEPQPSKGFRATAYEIKISRSDFRRDSHRKQRFARTFSDQFYYVTPPGLLGEQEIPDWAGLIEWDGSALRKVVPAVMLDKAFPSWELVVSLIRYNGEIRRDVGQQEQLIRSLKRQIEDAKTKLPDKGIQPWEVGIYG
ncbi:MmcB family DNA repair protein [Sphingosinicella ginsenosidimutans]|uniref:MmcB family DNA repair protein n=1 Tax=Allosphingosinicella ginsenosidimutans TaxID=1176539 RepID=A0A5C6TTH8_9SPHN|nr:MmcB family DNA repair protein [Sphingosinicella ginsenosidimutans]TXC63713.1 hypothetical protein FRZ32_08605 [Sphingosinicella ginsenosidimutans]